MKKLNFKDILFDNNDNINLDKDKVKREILDSIDDIINTEFNNVVFSIQKRYKKISKELEDRIDKELEDLEYIEIDDFKKEVYECVENEFKQATKNIIKQMPEVNK